jgi:hypothetical protein
MDNLATGHHGVLPAARYAAAWTELRGYVQAAVDDGGTIDAAILLGYMDELRQRAVAPVREWARRAASGTLAE